MRAPLIVSVYVVCGAASNANSNGVASITSPRSTTVMLLHERGGTMAQAWNTAELLRSFALIDGTLPLDGAARGASHG